jgi:hypothetical protein
MLGLIISSVEYNFQLKMLLLVLIKNCNSCVCWMEILSIKLDLNRETHFTILHMGLSTADSKQVLCRVILFKVLSLGLLRSL